jgi:hypothetical protein
MSVPSQHAVAEFIDLLNPQQKIRFEASLSYTRGRFNYLAGNYKVAKEDLLIAMRYGHRKFLLKTLLMIIITYLRDKMPFMYKN